MFQNTEHRGMLRLEPCFLGNDMPRVDGVRLALASPEQILSWSSGEVTVPDTFNYAGNTAIKDGLFCERIFGPQESWHCRCGQIQGADLAGKPCPRCGVMVAHRRERRERMGHIRLAVPLAHVWFVKATPNPIALLLEMTPRDVERVVYCAADVVYGIDAKTMHRRADALSAMGLKPDDIRLGMVLPLGSLSGLAWIKTSTGAWALRELLKGVELAPLAKRLARALAETEGPRRKQLQRQLNVVRGLYQSGIRPEWMVLEVLPVLPADLRPVIEMDGGRYAVADATELYRRLLQRNRRYPRLLQIGAPRQVLNNERRLLQVGLDALLNNGRHGAPMLDPTGRPYRSLTDAISGKGGRFRQNLLGKRVDFSGRSVIAVGPTLKPQQCGLPVTMALELFRPFVVRQLRQRGLVKDASQGHAWIDRGGGKDTVMAILEEVLMGKVVLLNRAPTLHRLSIQAFEPVLVSGSVIRLHPLWCTPFNADFDGDQMAVHVPLSDEAQDEARELMLSTHNVLVPADGSIAVSPSKDMVFGLYYMTMADPGGRGAGKRFLGFRDAIQAYDYDVIGLQSAILVKALPEDLELWQLESPGGWLETTAGRIMFNQALPKRLRFSPDMLYPVDKGVIKRLMRLCCDEVGAHELGAVADRLKELGFRYATAATGSLSVWDLTTPPGKQAALDQAQAEVSDIEEAHRRGLVSDDEAHGMRVALWERTTEAVTALVRDGLDPLSTLALVANSGAAKGEMNQIRQLVGMRGLMADPAGRVIDYPIRSSFREGLSPIEYFISTHGARKGMADIALRTAKAGYLTRRLINVAQDAIITEEDCRATNGGLVLSVDALGEEQFVASATSRSLARAVEHPAGGVVAEANSLVGEGMARAVLAAGVHEVWVRSPITCEAMWGLCVRCYGRHLGTGELVRIGDAVGIVAAQSIGEPGTQLTMRTFHTGGVAGADITSGLPRVTDLLEGRCRGTAAVMAPVGGVVQMAGNGRIEIRTGTGVGAAVALPAGQRLLLTEGSRVAPGEVIAAVAGWLGETMSADRCTVAPAGGTLVSERPEEVIIRHAGGVERVAVDIPVGARVVVKEGDVVEAGAALTDGDVDPRDMVGLMGMVATQWRVVREVQKVYRSQGAAIHDKHLEVIARQMGRYVQISEPGDSRRLVGDLVDRFELTLENERLWTAGGKPASGLAVFVGITRAAMARPSFLAGAAFQFATRVLTDAALRGDLDRLRGLKENVIVGNLIPCGTGVEA